MKGDDTTMIQTGRPVLIIGGGIGGLATAVALRAVGISATVLESRPEPATVGAGIQVASNAIKALRQLGLAESVERLGTKAETFQFRSSTGRILQVANVGDMGRKYGAHSVFISRADLLSTLYRAVDPGMVRFGAKVVDLAARSDGVRVKLEDGTEEWAELVVGADGVNSPTRRHVVAKPAARYAGYQDWRAVVDYVPAGLPPATWFMVWGRGARFGIGHAGKGRAFWFAVLNTRADGAETMIGGKAGLLQRFSGWADPVPAMLEATPADSISWSNIKDIDPLKQWSSGRVVLMGDAAHAATPNLGRGAGEAIEDAVALAQSLGGLSSFSDTKALAERLQAYEAQRRGPTTRVIRRSRRMGRFGQLEGAASCAVRETLMGLTPSRIATRALESDFRHSVSALQPFDSNR